MICTVHEWTSSSMTIMLDRRTSYLGAWSIICAFLISIDLHLATYSLVISSFFLERGII